MAPKARGALVKARNWSPPFLKDTVKAMRHFESRALSLILHNLAEVVICSDRSNGCYLFRCVCEELELQVDFGIALVDIKFEPGQNKGCSNAKSHPAPNPPV